MPALGPIMSVGMPEGAPEEGGHDRDDGPRHGGETFVHQLERDCHECRQQHTAHEHHRQYRAHALADGGEEKRGHGRDSERVRTARPA